MFFRISLLKPDPMIFFPFAETDFTIVDFLHHLPGSEFFYDFALGIESGDIPVIAFLPLACVLEAVGKVFFSGSVRQTLLKLSDEVTSIFPNQSPQSLV